MKFSSLAQGLSALATCSYSVEALKLDPKSIDSIKNVSSTLAKQLVAQYAVVDAKGGYRVIGGYPGILYPPYYWWQAGAMLGTLLDYWHYTGDNQYNGMIRDGLIHNFGENLDLMPGNQSKNEGNDDQVFWAFSMIAAAEYKLPDPPPDKPGWLAMTQSVMNQFIGRFEKEVKDGVCGGGMRWQIFPWLNGWTYKNTASNGGLFHLGARLAVYTRNDTYARWAEKAYDWMAQSPILLGDGSVNDGTLIYPPNNAPACSTPDRTQWTYNYGIMIAGSAYMYNYTNGAQKWKDRLVSFINKTDIFFREDRMSVMVEPCEELAICDADQASFKGYLSRWMGITIQVAPFTYDLIMPRLELSAVRAAQTCTGPSPKGGGDVQCGMRWYRDGFDGFGGIGPQMSALNTVVVLNAPHAEPPATNATGGTSSGNSTLGTGDDQRRVPVEYTKASAGDKAGAAILTIIIVTAWFGAGYFMLK